MTKMTTRSTHAPKRSSMAQNAEGVAADAPVTVDVTVTYRATVTFDGSRRAALRAYKAAFQHVMFESPDARKEYDESEEGVEYTVKLASAIVQSAKALREAALSKVLLDLDDRISRGACEPVWNGNVLPLEVPRVRKDVAGRLDDTARRVFLGRTGDDNDDAIGVGTSELSEAGRGALSARVRIRRRDHGGD